MKRTRNILTMAVALALTPLAALAGQVRFYATAMPSSQSTSTYTNSGSTLIGQGPIPGALISNQNTAATGSDYGLSVNHIPVQSLALNDLFADMGYTNIVGGNAGGGVIVQNANGRLVRYPHARARFGVVTPNYWVFALGGAVGYTIAQSPTSMHFAARVTPDIAIAYKNDVRIHYRQSPWSINGNNAPRDLLATGLIHGFQVKGGALLADAQGYDNGYLVSLITPRADGFRGTVSYVGGLQGGQVVGPLNPSRPWDSYASGTFVQVSKRLVDGVKVAGFASFQGANGGSSTSTQIVSTSTKQRDLGLELSDTF